MIASIVEQKLATLNSASNLLLSSTSGIIQPSAQQHLPRQDFNLGTPEETALLHTNYRVPSIASHLSNSCIAAITNGEYVDLASLLPLSSLLRDHVTANSQLKLQPTQERTTLTPQALDPPSQRLAVQDIPPKAAIEYLSKLSPTTPIDLPQLALYLRDHP
ncbi:unnamed protein product [Porites evermanni]|uniref:Uncharacterized protein n=1 Tax=Porites evermanni TaxID=104178 RepID=A0ABN8LMY9_9CNID|nr:unnamed protein product [Porites evermanni]